MSPFLVPGILLVLFFGAWAVLFLRYRASPAGAWKKRVMDHYKELNYRLARAQGQVDHTQRDKDRACDRIRATFRDRFRRSISVAALDDYPNIGPATVESLRQAGYRCLSDFNALNAVVTGKIPGIGAAKWGYITSAVAQLEADCEEKFRSGSFPDADEMDAQLRAANREMEQRALAAAAEIQVVQETRDQMTEQVAMAQQITFFGSISGQKIPGLTDEFMNRPLPQVGSIVTHKQPKAPPQEIGEPVPPEVPRPKPKPKTDDPFAHHVPGSSSRRAPSPKVIETKSIPPAPPVPATVNDSFDEAGCRRILEIDPKWELSVDLIRRQYHLLSEKNDPDKLKNMAEDVIAFTRQKRDRIRKAAETLVARFGEPLEKPVAAPPSDPRHNPDLDAVFG